MARILTGVPLAMRQDGWWLDEAVPPEGRKARQRRWDVGKAWVLALLILLGDVLLWQAMPGLSLALFAGCVVLAGVMLVWPETSPRQRVGIAAGAVLSVLPLVELVQPLSVFIALVGLSAVCVALAGLRHPDLVRGALRLWWVAPWQTAQDTVRGAEHLGNRVKLTSDPAQLVRGWALPMGATAVFALLLIGANPVFDRALNGLARWQPQVEDPARLWFWGALALIVWPWLVTRSMTERLRYTRPRRATVRREGVINAGSVARSLVAFNLLFALQTGSDLMFLYGDAALPEGISPAAYAHRGAYPLLATALLAGFFAVLARPFVQGRVVRAMMLLWLAQTLALVVASVWRLDLYVEAYGLTRLRLAAYIWMGVVAVGVGLVAWQIWQNRRNAWMLVRAGGLGAVTLYMCAFVNFDHIVATHNLTRNVPEDRLMLCRLSESAIPAIERHSGEHILDFCHRHPYYAKVVSVPNDWREWGFRNWRLRTSLAAMQTTDARAP